MSILLILDLEKRGHEKKGTDHDFLWKSWSVPFSPAEQRRAMEERLVAERQRLLEERDRG